MALRFEGFEVASAATGADAIASVAARRPQLLVLDVMLPDIDGFEVARRLASAREEVPIIFLTARDSTEDVVRGLTIGGDDYVTKPFSLEELIARIRTILRRTGLREDDSSKLVVRRPRARRGHPRGQRAASGRSSSPRPSSACCAT